MTGKRESTSSGTPTTGGHQQVGQEHNPKAGPTQDFLRGLCLSKMLGRLSLSLSPQLDAGPLHCKSGLITGILDMGQRQSVVLAAALTAPAVGCGSSFTAAGPLKVPLPYLAWVYPSTRQEHGR
jgi:hypothetical protein